MPRAEPVSRPRVRRGDLAATASARAPAGSAPAPPAPGRALRRHRTRRRRRRCRFRARAPAPAGAAAVSGCHTARLWCHRGRWRRRGGRLAGRDRHRLRLFGRRRIGGRWRGWHGRGLAASGGGTAGSRLSSSARLVNWPGATVFRLRTDPPGSAGAAGRSATSTRRAARAICSRTFVGGADGLLDLASSSCTRCFAW